MAEPAFQLKVDSSDAKRKFERFSRATQDKVVKQSFKKLFDYWTKETGRLFQRAGKATGGNYRGETWAGFAPQYVRKTDGVVVPAWGGVGKLYGHSNVKGRKRGRGRVTRTSKLMQDTGTMFANITTRPATITNRRMRLGVQGRAAKYAPYQQRMRKFMFWRVPQDERVGGRIFGRRIMQEAQRQGLR